MKVVNEIALALGVMIGALASESILARPAEETIRYAVTFCYGACPIDSVAVTPDGTVTFDGERR